MLVSTIKYAACQKIEVHLNNFTIITFQNFKEMYSKDFVTFCQEMYRKKTHLKSCTAEDHKQKTCLHRSETWQDQTSACVCTKLKWRSLLFLLLIDHYKEPNIISKGSDQIAQMCNLT